MKRILRSRLPERFADRVPPLAVEVAVGLIITALMVLLRLGLVPWAGDRAPYAFVFIAVVGAAVLAGWRSGLLALIVGQALAWKWVVDPASYALQRTEYLAGLAVATFSQLVLLAIIWLYQREVDRAWSRREEQVDLMRHALAEIDHRTTNNYQTVLALVQAQAHRADGPVKQALLQVAGRIEAIAMASKQLALRSDSLEKVRVSAHLGDLCTQIKRGLSRPGVSVECHSEDVSLDADKAIALSIIINELVTNALKHAFPDSRNGSINVSLNQSAEGLRLEVADNGIGMKQGTRTRGGGLGSRLIDTFVKQLQADYRISSNDGGSRHLITIPV